jgi:hypothetical protein
MTTSSELLTLLAVSPASAEERVLRVLIELGAQVVDASEGSLLVFDPEKNDLAFAMNVGGSDVLIGQRVPLNQGLTGLAAATREVQIGAPTFKGVKQASSGPEAVIAAPMLVGDDLVGVITAVSFVSGKRFTARDGDLYSRLAAIAGVVVDQRRRLNAAASGVQTTSTGPEHTVAASIGRIAKSRPDALKGLATILAEIEALVAPSSSEQAE